MPKQISREQLELQSLEHRIGGGANGMNMPPRIGMRLKS